MDYRSYSGCCLYSDCQNSVRLYFVKTYYRILDTHLHGRHKGRRICCKISYYIPCLLYTSYGIPLKLSHTVIDIKGKERVEGVTLAEVDENRRPIKGTEEFYSCDTLLLSVGLIPENEISGSMGVELNPITSGPKVNERLETSIEGVFALSLIHIWKRWKRFYILKRMTKLPLQKEKMATKLL